MQLTKLYNTATLLAFCSLSIAQSSSISLDSSGTGTNIVGETANVSLYGTTVSAHAELSVAAPADFEYRTTSDRQSGYGWWKYKVVHTPASGVSGGTANGYISYSTAWSQSGRADLSQGAVDNPNIWGISRSYVDPTTYLANVQQNTPTPSGGRIVDSFDTGIVTAPANSAVSFTLSWNSSTGKYEGFVYVYSLQIEAKTICKLTQSANIEMDADTHWSHGTPSVTITQVNSGGAGGGG